MKYLSEVPQTLLDDLAENKVVPVVGAGFSKNAILPKGCSMPDWNQLGKKVGEYIPNYEYLNAIDSLSLFESYFSRVKLIEILNNELHINDIVPGDAHFSFCNLFLDTICTTNFDFLIEEALKKIKRPHSVIVSEKQLSINTYDSTKLIKLHGDFNHPEQLVITEEDYDCFIERNKILATYIANMFITKTILLIGYSFEDIDTRNIWKIVQERLGKLARPAYVVLVDANPIEISRFERRNIRVINLKGEKADYPSILNQFFIEIKQYIDDNQKITATNEKAQSELMLPQESKRLCFVSAPISRMSYIKELVYPILEKYGIVPITNDEIIMPGESIFAKSEALLREASFVIADISGNSEAVMWELVRVRNMSKNLIIIADREQEDLKLQSLAYQARISYSVDGDNQDFICRLEQIISELVSTSDNSLTTEPQRLFEKQEYDAAVISSFRLLEMTLREYYYAKGIFLHKEGSTLNYMLKQLLKNKVKSDLVQPVINDLRIRNCIVHGVEANVSSDLAYKIVNQVSELINYLREETKDVNKE